MLGWVPDKGTNSEQCMIMERRMITEYSMIIEYLKKKLSTIAPHNAALHGTLFGVFMARFGFKGPALGFNVVFGYQ